MATAVTTNMRPIPAARKAEKRLVKLKMAIQGPSGSGKTEGALALATNLWPESKILLVDTENESASLYADRYNFDTIPLDPPFESARYEVCIDYAVANGYDVLILDTISPQWDGEGGILRRKEELDRRPGSNSFTNWATFTPEHTHFIVCFRQACMT
jgi:AAA domain